MVLLSLKYHIHKYRRNFEMILPKELTDILNDAKKELLSHPKGEMILPIRKSIWKLLGFYNIDTNNKAIPTVGLKRRTKLAVICVKKVIHIWNEALPDDKRPLELIDEAEKYINGNSDFEAIQKQIGRFPTDLENLNCEEKYQNAVSVGFASLRAASIALHDERFIILGKDNALDDDYDPFSWDASYFAALTYSGSGPWDNSNVAKRQEFWLWYIDKAIPEAYVAFSE
jgi:hypothetical protein